MISKSARPFAITMGDPSGIGPEIIAKLVAKRGAELPLAVLGDHAVMQRAIDLVDLGLVLKNITHPNQAVAEKGTLFCLPTSQSALPPAYGVVSPPNGQAAYDAIIAGIDWAKQGEIGAIITAPIHKEALAAAGIKFPGHTEILGHFGGVEKVAMMLVNEDIRTVLVSIHCSLSDAINAVTVKAELAAIRLAYEGCIALGIPNPRIAVAGLNPHAGEGGLFGREEIEIISPAIQTAKSMGLDVSGPWPGDTVFMSARKGEFDVVVAQYHDQGLIPIKYLGLEKGVNITLGLPFVRTSPDHGTAFDIAGKGIADMASLEAALDVALKLAGTR